MRSISIFHAIKRIIDTEILNNLIEDSVNQKTQTSQTKDEETVGELLSYHFVNTVMVHKKSSNLLSNNVIYDSECDYSLTHDKSCFRNEIRLAKNK